MTLEIPELGVSMPIVGVPQSENGWDVSWLGNGAGYLAGSAFPTWAGNTVITGHVWDAYNQPGAFAELKSLKYGDQVQILAWGQTYTYEVRESKLVTKKIRLPFSNPKNMIGARSSPASSTTLSAESISLEEQ